MSCCRNFWDNNSTRRSNVVGAFRKSPSTTSNDATISPFRLSSHLRLIVAFFRLPSRLSSSSSSSGRLGKPGDRGEPGVKGLPTPFPGPFGPSGAPGLSGQRGEPGYRGPPGDQGPTGRPGRNGTIGLGDAGHLFALHSQNEKAPECPPFTSPLYNGYSLVTLQGDGDSVTMDLGTPGSCLRKFSLMPYVSCFAEANGHCHANMRNGRSYWLATLEHYMMQPRRVEYIEPNTVWRSGDFFAQAISRNHSRKPHWLSGESKSCI
ncbi:unnamed protein product [Protopolystoma xenopodis]|uniref:Collagen IV NC1 domain-containing protein n=1 Tax=Protopolystoma xenopodis TaxID=117903 RepID=A0A448XHY9_9PLAT|nr:unnamed protein product [Protopolystoma xenopodis]